MSQIIHNIGNCTRDREKIQYFLIINEILQILIHTDSKAVDDVGGCIKYIWLAIVTGK